MERVNYSEIIQEILKRHSYNDLDNGTEVQLIFDKENHHYQVIHLGWQEQRRVYGCIVHVDLKNEKIWIQRDGTEIGIANELVAAGVPKHDIVLGFQAPYKRKFTDFAFG
ncbi:XisI protein [Aphanothece hegewaldii CCALA 016]|uniref:XisI protein n=1 Tax=Aphanothece hegewaldii CCALA 016 TaxID=2107694 RepID=A0A2T1M163_9CHRO|nr:XisI protein [Aphanothece hegewaldii]PSF38415.1 XisI protein [Aphanothece hegewaldii CCALA 016]